MESKNSEKKQADTGACLPLPKMPDCWKDDMRMNSLFAPFREKTVNPLDWDSKQKFWNDIISDWCLHKSSPSFTLLELRKAFQRDGRTALCFPTVIETMKGNNELCLYQDFVNITPEKSWTAWTVDVLVKHPLVWSFNKVKDKIVTPSPVKAEEEFVHLEVAKRQAETLLATISDDHKDQIYELNELSVLFKEKTGSATDIRLAIHALRRSGKAAFQESSEGNCLLIKLAKSTESKAVITELDLGVHALKRNEAALSRHVAKLEKEKEEVMTEARVFLKKGMRPLAKGCLRRKNELEKCITKRASALENVQLLLCRIREAETDSKVLDAYKLGVAALKTTFKEAGLTEDSVANTVDDVEEALDIHAEIQATLSKPIGDSADEDLEGELAELLANDPSPPPTGPSPKKHTPPEEDTKIEMQLEERLRALRATDLPEPPSSPPKIVTEAR